MNRPVYTTGYRWKAGGPCAPRRIGWLVGWLLLLVALGVAPLAAVPAARATGQQPFQAVGVDLGNDGSIRLSSNDILSPAALAVEAGNFQQYGFYIAAPQTIDVPTSRVRLSYVAATPAGSKVEMDVRASFTGQQWTSWEIDVPSDVVVEFGQPVRQVQYRARLFGMANSTPIVYNVQLETGTLVDDVASYATRVHQANSPREAVAPTYRIRGTRMGMVGGRTANGHIIQPRDHYVSLPSWASLASRGGYEYQVRVSYNGRSGVAPVWDVGPWNTRDNYWDFQRERYNELERGWPQDHAAYYDGHNGGYAEKGYVRFPTAIDVGDGVWWDELGIVGDQAWVEVTFLWLGRDPQEVPPADPPSSDPNAAEYMVDELGPAFVRNPVTWFEGPAGCGANDYTLWTLSVTTTAQSENEAFWQPDLPIGGLFDVYAHVPICPVDYPVTASARYLIQHSEGSEEVVVNQTEQTHWVHLGRFPFEAGSEGFVYLTDVAGERGHAIWFDNIKWVPVRDA